MSKRRRKKSLPKPEAKKSRHVFPKLAARAAKKRLDPLLEEQFVQGRLLAAAVADCIEGCAAQIETEQAKPCLSVNKGSQVHP